MISMESDVYQKTPLGSEKPVTGVPTVLYVSPTGAISEIETPRDKKAMTEMIVSKPQTNAEPRVTSIEPILPSSEPAKPMLPRANSNLFKAVSTERKTSSELRRMEDAIIPNTMLSENPLSPIPATPIPSEVQKGGDPFSAFLLAAAQQAAPAAALLGAYAALPAKRSSGLGAPRKTRKARRARKAIKSRRS